MANFPVSIAVQGKLATVHFSFSVHFFDALLTRHNVENWSVG